jgi:hypothetical protein
MRFSRGAALGSSRFVSGLVLAPLFVLGCATRTRAPNLAPIASPEPTLAQSPPATASEGLADASTHTAARPATSEGSYAADAGTVVSHANEAISHEQLREGTGFRTPGSLRVRRETQERGLDSRVSVGILTVDAQGTLVWSFDEPPLQLSIAGYQIRSTTMCGDARRAAGAEWLALAPLQKESAGSFRLRRGLGDEGETIYVAELIDSAIQPSMATKIVYRLLADAGLEAVVAQLRGKSYWRTVRYTLRSGQPNQARPRKVAFARCPQDAGVGGGVAF